MIFRSNKLSLFLKIISVVVVVSGLFLMMVGESEAQTATFQQDGGSQGLVSMEAENYDINTSGANGASWVADSTAGYSGTGAMKAMPDSGINQNTGYAVNSPELEYRINFVKTGTHYVWVRGWALDGSSDSVHAGLDGAEISTADRILVGSFGSWVWTKATMDGINASINVSPIGLHTLNIWMREDGFIIDKIVLTTDSAYVPSGNGPAETLAPTLVGHWKLDDGLGAEKITNGTFDSSITGWETNGWSTISWQNALSGDGSTGYMRFNIDNNIDYDRFATIAGVTSPNKTYQVSFWYRTSGITGNLRAFSTDVIGTLDTTASWASAQITPSTSWTYFSTTLTVDSADYPVFGISKLGSIGSGTFDIDAISVKEITTTTTAVDSSGNGNNGTLINGPVWTTGKIDGALQFDGVDDYVNLGIFNFGSVFTISAWVNINSGESNIQTIMANAGSGAATNGFRIFVNTYGTSDQKLWIETGNGSTAGEAVSAASAVPYAGWHHIVAIVDRANGLANAYVDNVQVITNDGILTDFANNQTTNIGQMTNNTYRFGGKMDDVRAYNYALSASEVSDLYNAGGG
ncbi:MAG: hypothetical protein COU46_02535, partial [Candidatus Niyogibacteria bacterium CG10_big_fil_rev_8_21_14_0_10_42_19]